MPVLTTAAATAAAMTGLSWAAKAASGVQQAEKVVSTWKRFARLFKRGNRIVITGLPNVGKSVLVDYLSGKAGKKTYALPDRSRKKEEVTLAGAEENLGLVVLPGQEPSFRTRDYDKIFHGRKAIDGWIHVVSYGYTKPRTRGAQQVWIGDQKLDTIEKLREHVLRQEVEDVEKIGELVRSTFKKHRKPEWAIVAVTKCDLFANDLDEAEKYYTASGGSEFAKKLESLRSMLGTDFFSWTPAPVCSVLDDFEWNGGIIKSQLGETNRNNLLIDFNRSLEAEASPRMESS